MSQGDTKSRVNPDASRRSRVWTWGLLVVLVLLSAAAPALATTVTFRQGANGYTGCVDTYLAQNPANAGTSYATSAVLSWDGDDPSGTGYDQYALIRFDNIIGTGAGLIPPMAQITSATLTYTVSDVGDTGQLHEIRVTWQATDTYNSFCGGSCDEGIEYGPQVGAAPATTATQYQVSVTNSVQAWVNGSVNRGWIFIPTGTGGVDIRSSKYGTVTDRPLLTIVYDEGQPSSQLVRQPYLQMGTPTSMTVAWRTENATDSRVRYGTVQGTLNQTATSAAVGADHFVTITGLTPGTRYYYDIGSTSAVQGGGTAEHYFVTSPDPLRDPPQPFRVWIFGDSGICNTAQTQVRDAMLAYTGAARPDLFLHAGDVAQVSGQDTEYTDCHFAVYQDILRHTPFWPAEGNHDSYSTSCTGNPLTDPVVCTGPYFTAFQLPTAGEAGGVPSGTEAYYSFDYGNTHFIALNGTVASRSGTGAMANWLRADLAATNQQWIVVYWHQPPYTKGTHNSDTESDLIELRQNIVPILDQYGVDLVLFGHSHSYERSYLIDGTYSTPTPTFGTLLANGNILDDGDGNPAGDGPYQKSPGRHPHEGTIYTVTGTGGMGPGGSVNHPVMRYSEAVNGSTLIDVDANTLNVLFLRSDGSVRDRFAIAKGDLPPRIAATLPPKSSVLSTLTSVEVTFNMPVTGVDAGDLSVNGSPATAVSGTGPYTFTGFALPGDGLVQIVMNAGGIAKLGDPGLLFAGDSWSYTIDTTPPRLATIHPARGASVGVLPAVTVTFTKPVTGAAAGDLRVNGAPATVLSGNDGTAGPYSFSGYPTPPDGRVTIQMVTGSIRDEQGQLFAGDTWTNKLTRRLVINEFLGSNNTAVTDENGEFDDYVEIYNPSDATVDMSGMYLTDDMDSPAQYRIPDGVTVPAHGYTVFWCDSQPGQGPHHTNFNILRTGEDLALYDTDANGLALIDGFTFPTQTTDVASGRFPDGVDGFVAMRPTPGAANTISCTGDAQCTALGNACNVGRCVANLCVAEPANEGGACDDGVACRGPDTCTAGVCNGGADLCTAGQVCELDTGLCVTPVVAPLPILVGDEWRYFKGTQEPSPGNLTAWTGIGFDDAAWLHGTSGFGFGADCTAQRGTTLTDMTGAYVSLYARRQFRVDNPALVSSLSLTMDYDDGYVAYLNGTEVDRDNVVGTPPAFGQLATVDHECSSCNSSPCHPAVSRDLTPYLDLLVPGVNVLAIQAHNLTAASSDFTLVASLTGVEQQGCTFNSDCNDSNLCTDDACVGGLCVHTADNSNPCSDNNPCTDDACVSGACVGTADNTNLCSDGVACTSDLCTAGVCVSTDSCTGGETCNHGTGTCESAPTTLTFQEGFNGYTGTQDTELTQATPAGMNGALETWRWDTDDPGATAQYVYGLIRFDGIFGAAPGQIPPGSTITSATLTIQIYNASAAPAGNVYEAKVGWSESDATWNNFGGDPGVQADEYGSFVAVAPLPIGSAAINVTSSLQAWTANPAGNLGWVFVPASTDGAYVRSSEYAATPAERPRLTVTFIPAAPACTGDPDCDDGLFCNGSETCQIATGLCLPGTPIACTDGIACTLDTCNETTNMCDHVAAASLCDDGNACTDDTCDVVLGCLHADNTGPCNDGNACSLGDVCAGGTCQAGSGTPDCNDNVACTADSCNPASGCAHADTCPIGQTCNAGTGLCETGPALAAGDVIIAGFQATNTAGTQNPAEFIELFNTTNRVISLESLEIIARVDQDPGDGTVEIDWRLSGENPNLAGKSIAPHGFFLVAESGVAAPGGNLHDLETNMDLTTSEGGSAERSIGVELVIGGVHMDSILYGRNDGVTPAGALPPGDRPFDGVSWPRTEVIRATASTTGFTDGVCRRLSAQDLYAGYAVEGFYTDEDALPGTYPNGVWTSPHSADGSYQARNSLSPVVPPPSQQPCSVAGDCDDHDACNGLETCVNNFCQGGTPPACDDGNACTNDSCNPATGCAHANNTATCDDGNACTLGDACAGGSCSGTPITCNDGVACTNDSCNPASGCQYADACTGGAVCDHGTGTCQTAPLVATFRQGVSGYAGTVDTYLQAGLPDTDESAANPLIVDGTPPTTDQRQILLRFGGLFASEGGPIPDGSQITSATLTIHVTNGSLDGAELHRMLRTWSAADTWNTLTGGVQTDDVEAVAATDASGSYNAPVPALFDLDVTASVAAWSAGSANRGWVWVTPAGGSDSWQFDSAEGALPPLLRVTYLAPSTTHGRMTCRLSSATASAGGSVRLEVSLEDLGGLPGIRGYQTQIGITRTSGSGTAAVPCPAGVRIDDARGDYLFTGRADDHPVANCGLMRAASALLSGSVTLGGSPAYLAEYTIDVSLDASPGSRFRIDLSPYPGSSLADASADPVDFEVGPFCELTVGSCTGPAECGDGNPCTDDTCEAGVCRNTIHAGNACDDGDACTTGDTCAANGACLGGTPISCDDGDACTADSCNAGQCRHTAGGACGVSGNVRYYRDSATSSEPSAKPTPNVRIDVGNDTLPDAVTGAGGTYAVGGLSGTVSVGTLAKFGSPRASDHNDAVSSFDAVAIARHSVGSELLSANQQIAGDVTGNGQVTSLDAAKVAQFAVELIDHFDVAVTTGSDWRFLRCDNYVSAGNQNCGAPMYLHNPLAGTPADNFYAILYGDVTGNWAPQAGLAPTTTLEAQAARLDRQQVERLRSTPGLRAARPTRSGAGHVYLAMDGRPLAAGERRQVTLNVDNAGGIESLDLRLVYDPTRFAIHDVQAAGVGGRFALVSNDQQGVDRIGMYGILPLEGSGPVLTFTIEAVGRGGRNPAISVDATANEGAIPLSIERRILRTQDDGARRK